MKGKIIKVFAISVISFLLTGCDPEPMFTQGEVKGYKPVYKTTADVAISFGAARAIHKPGKIYIYGSYLLVNEQSEGIHVFDNQDPSAPEALGFLDVYGNVDMAVKNNVLFVDHIGSLVSLDISDLNHIKELSRFQTWSNTLPPNPGYYFECVDPEKGEVIGWELTTLKNPECYK
jgi:hypothetical protein